MSDNIRESNVSEESIDFIIYWKAIIKKKYFLLSLTLAVILIMAIVTSLSPKIYKGEIIYLIDLKRTSEIAEPTLKHKEQILTNKELVDILGKFDNGERQLLNILKAKNLPVRKIIFSEIRGSNDMFRLHLETYNPNKFPELVSEISNYINSIPQIDHNIQNQKVMLKKQIKEFSIVIEQLETSANNMEKMLKDGKFNSIGFNPVVSRERASQLKIKKMELEQNLSDIGIKITSQEFSKRAMRRGIIKKSIIAGFAFFILGILIIIFLEYIKQIRKEEKND